MGRWEKEGEGDVYRFITLPPSVLREGLAGVLEAGIMAAMMGVWCGGVVCLRYAVLDGGAV